ncbi:serine protease inhibitor 42Dd [Drosophila teissieri]|uniref:serine protease inhibitor 42Dd n=1 Tax=Drosophila teissieri TaxID=7243 RepID=UPI001CBA0E1A|nr:serine protease inhibitor 42Dd [Drosophila teissieri]
MRENSKMKYFVLLLMATSVLGRFKQNILEMVMAKAENNFIVSPLCIEIGMSMLFIGAKGKTAEELRSVLDLPVDMTEVARNYEKVLANLQKHNGFRFANRLYVNDAYEINQDYNNIMNNTMGKAHAGNPSLRSRPIHSISFAVQRQTHRKMRTIFNEHELQANESAALVTAVQYIGAWKTMFEKRSTKLKKFYGDNNKPVYVRMMSHVGRFRTADQSYGQVIELPFSDSNLSMIIGLPLHNSYLSSIEQRLRTFSESLEETDVHVELPKFEIEFSTELVEPLKKLGIHLLFSNNSDLSGLLTNGTSAKISNVVHKSSIEIDEGGVSTGEAAEPTEYPPKKAKALVSFNVNRPFAFLIRDKHAVYFRGRVVQLPNEIRF